MGSLGLSDVFTVTYVGNMGLAQEIDVLAEILERFKGRRDIQFVFIGGGVRKIDLERLADKMDNIFFVNYQSKSNLSGYLGTTDLGIVTLKPKMEGLAFPSRTYTYFAAGIPILAIAHQDSDLRVLTDRGLGVHFTPESIVELTDFLEERIALGRRGFSTDIRNYFDIYCNRTQRTDQYLDLLQTLTDGKTRSTPTLLIR